MRGLRWLREAVWPTDPLAGMKETHWLAHARSVRPDAIALVVPKWYGITSATSHLFPVVLPIPSRLTARAAARVARLLIASETPRVVYGAFAPGMLALVEQLAHACPRIEQYALCHSSLMQQGERTSWLSLKMLMELARAGTIRRIGFVKAGMAELLQAIGVPASFVGNAIHAIPAGPSTPRPGGPHLGIWAVNASVWRKLPFAMLAAARTIPGAQVTIGGANARVREFAKTFGIVAEIHERPFPPSEMPERLGAMHVNLYVTLSECAPMVPLESLAVGVPCLFGPNSHLLEDHRYLHDRLVVPYPDRHEVIARYIRRALEERETIISEYRAYLPRYLERSRRSVAEFLGLGGEVQRQAA
jgi:hypothetical protein